MFGLLSRKTMKINGYLFGLTLLVGCDTRVIVGYGQPSTHEESVSCSYAGFCYECGLDIMNGGDFNCNFAFHPSCSGHQKALVERTPYTWYWKSNPDTRMVGYSDRVIKRYGDCE